MEPVAPPASGDGVMAQQLKPAQRQQRHQVADVQAVGRGVEAAVERDRARADALGQFLRVGAIGQQAAPLEFFQDVHGEENRLTKADFQHRLSPCRPLPRPGKKAGGPSPACLREAV